MKGLLQIGREKRGSMLLIALLLCASALIMLPSLQDADGSAMTNEEKRISTALSRIAGAGETRVAISYSAQESGTLTNGRTVPSGAIIVSAGAGEIAVRLDLQRAVQTLLGLPAGAVEVFAAEERK